ncbi:MAG: hypothetical protein IPL60_11610 [Ardenticatenia bacterium]|nr:hypothetical protein [Ardenticatenia bacterium]
MITAYRLNGKENAEIHPGETFSLELDLVNAGAGAAQQTRMVLGAGGAGSGAGSAAGASAGAASLGSSLPWAPTTCASWTACPPVKPAPRP